jgi:tetratricopeptide (TPR) repeat protein
MSSSSTDSNRDSTYWLYGGSAFLLMLALFWSVDSIVIYVCLGGATFCFTQYILKTKRIPTFSEKTISPERETVTGKRIEEVLEEIQREFSTTKPINAGAVKAVFRTIAVFLVVFFVISVVSVLVFNDDIAYSDNYYRAQEFISTETYDSALYYLQLAAQDNPSNPEVYIERGNVFMYMDRYDSASTQFDKAMVLDDRHSEAHYLKTYSLFQLTNYRETIEVGKRLVKREPENFSVMLLVGDSYYLQNRYDSALVWYTRAYDGGARSSALSNVIAYIHDMNGQLPTAIEFYKEAISLDSTQYDVYDRLAELLPGEEGNVYRAEAVRLKKGNY